MFANEDRLDGIIAGAVILIVGVIGIVLNVSAIVLIHRTPSFHNAFGYICASHLLADVGVLTIFSFWAAPASLFCFSETITQSYIGGRMGQLTVIFWFGSVYGQVQTALNRLLAISSPVKCSSTFSRRKTKQILAVFWILCCVHGIPYLFDCDFTFDAHSFLWTYSKSQCSDFISFYVALVYCGIVCAAVISIDTVAFFAIIHKIKNVKKMTKFTLRATDSVLLNKNIRLYMQGCLQAGCFALVTVSFFFFSRMATTKWALFVTVTLAWELAHAVDGLILIAFHEKFRVILRQPTLLWRSESTKNTTIFVTTSRGPRKAESRK